MAQEKKFINESIRKMQVENYLAQEFNRAGYSHTEIQRTPMAMRITVYAHKPGMIIGRGGKNIDRITEALKEKFKFENPQLDIQEVQQPNLDAHIIANQIANSIERGLNYKRVANMTIQKVMNSGAIGIAIRIGGKIGGAMSRVEKFSEGYLKYSGDTAETLVDIAYTTANVKLGMIGIQVRIMRELPSDRMISKKLMEGELNGSNEKETVERTE
ncbi:MAG: 30S ribosomal protein S3 [Candidatus Aenigmarchaeota archaeon]|nr:30S ribosomal protein S3 [Candidatus Aenigmarchaeota archaeon]